MTEQLPFTSSPWEARAAEVPSQLSPSVPLPISDPSRKSLSERLFLLDQILGLKDKVNSNLPTFAHSISVSVAGGPTASINRIWQLALATAFGRYRQAGVFGFQAADVKCTWDITGKNVQIILSYQNSGVLGLTNDFINTTPETFIMSGPIQETVGAPVETWLNGSLAVRLPVAVAATLGGVIGGIFSRSARGAQAGAAVAGLPVALLAKLAKTRDNKASQLLTLPDIDRVITTGQKLNENVQPPVPKYDKLSRTLPLIALISNALTDPGYLPAVPPQRLRPLKGKTKKVQLKEVTLNNNLPEFVDPNAITAAFGGLAGGTANPFFLPNPAVDKDPLVLVERNTRDDGYSNIPENPAYVGGKVNLK